jgi:transposase
MLTHESSIAYNPRSLRGLHIALNTTIKTVAKGYIVPSQSSSAKYVVAPDLSECTCLDYEQRQAPCKHIYAVRHTLEGLRETDLKASEEPAKSRSATTYPQQWPEYNAAQTVEKANFLILLRGLCQGIVEPPQMMGRPRLLYADMVFACAFKVYSGLSGRRFGSDLKEAQEKGYISKAPHFNSLYNYFDKAELTPLLRTLITVTSLPLKAIESDFAVDSSGFSTSRFARWYDAKHGKEAEHHDWVKMHLMTGVTTNVVSSVEMSGRHAHDSPYFEPLVEATARNFRVDEVSADLAYSSIKNLHAVTSRGGTPFIPFKSNATGNGGGDNLWRIMYHYYSLRRDDFLEHYHKRSSAESIFSMIKRKFGDSLHGKTDTAQVNETLFKVLCHNLCVVNQSMFELGIEATFCAELPVAQKV